MIPARHDPTNTITKQGTPNEHIRMANLNRTHFIFVKTGRYGNYSTKAILTKNQQ